MSRLQDTYAGAFGPDGMARHSDGKISSKRSKTRLSMLGTYAQVNMMMTLLHLTQLEKSETYSEILARIKLVQIFVVSMVTMLQRRCAMTKVQLEV